MSDHFFVKSFKSFKKNLNSETKDFSVLSSIYKYF